MDLPFSGHRHATGARVGILASLELAVIFVLACTLPGRPVLVLPEVAGSISGGGADARINLVLIHRESPDLHARQQASVTPDGRFRFEPISLDVAGHERSRSYRIYLHLDSGESDRVIWRVQLSRRKIAGPIQLSCELDRPIALGEPCRVSDPLAQPWLLAEGEHHFQRLCASCHGSDGRGGEVPRGAAPSPGPHDRAPDLTDLAARHAGHFERDEVAAWIEGRQIPSSHSRGSMPVWGERLSSEFERYAEGDELLGATLDPLVAFLEGLQRID